MAMKTLKSVGSRTPQNINIELDTLPENESDALCRTIISGMSRAFEDPAVMADYQNWKKQRQQRKAKVARYIVPIIQEQIERSGYETYLEPFCGGCNVIDKIEAPQRIASDCNKYLIALMQHIQAGGELPGYIEREE